MVRHAAIVLAGLLLSAGPAPAGFTVQVEYVDPDGVPRTVTAHDAAYTFFRRTLYRGPRKEGEPNYRDAELRLTSFPFASRRVPFQKIRQVRFERRTEEGRERLVLSFEITTGETFEMSGSDLEGAGHPISPALSLRTPQGSLSLPIDPLTPKPLRAGRPSPVRIEFPNNPDRRRPGRP